jgi:hypothetical protein
VALRIKATIEALRLHHHAGFALTDVVEVGSISGPVDAKLEDANGVKAPSLLPSLASMVQVFWAYQ